MVGTSISIGIRSTLVTMMARFQCCDVGCCNDDDVLADRPKSAPPSRIPTSITACSEPMPASSLAFPERRRPSARPLPFGPDTTAGQCGAEACVLPRPSRPSRPPSVPFSTPACPAMEQPKYMPPSNHPACKPPAHPPPSGNILPASYDYSFLVSARALPLKLLPCVLSSNHLSPSNPSVAPGISFSLKMW